MGLGGVLGRDSLGEEGIEATITYGIWNSSLLVHRAWNAVREQVVAARHHAATRVGSKPPSPCAAPPLRDKVECRLFVLGVRQ